MKIPTFQDRLRDAEFWRKTNEQSELRRAEQILRDGMAHHHYALPLGDELALVLEKQGRDAEALELLKELERRHQNAGEETLCRFGRIYKKRGDRQLDAGGFAMAYPNFEESERYYHLAFEKSHGFYPRINELTVRFLRASIAAVTDKAALAAPLLQSVHAGAKQMLADPDIWRERRSDDAIWSAATQAEAHFLLAEWTNAEQAYRVAMTKAAGNKFYFDCMASQVKMLLDACHRLNITPPRPLTEPALFFRP